MTSTHLVGICRAEISKLFSRRVARVGLVFAALLAILAPTLMWTLSSSGVTVNGGSLADTLDKSAPTVLMWGLEARNFFVVHAFLCMLGALSVAGEYNARTLREDTLRPVPRWVLPFSRWVALVTWSATTLLLAWSITSALGLIAFDTHGAWSDAALGYAVSLLSDAGFAALVIAVSLLTRSVAGTIGGVLLFLVLDTLIGWALALLDKASSMFELTGLLASAVALRPWLPSSAFDVWSGYAERQDWSWRGFVSLAVITLLCLFVSERTFARVDVP